MSGSGTSSSTSILDGVWLTGGGNTAAFMPGGRGHGLTSAAFAAASAHLVSGAAPAFGVLDAEAARELARQRMVEAAFDAGCVVEGELSQ